MDDISLRAVERLLKEAGCKRISDEAIKELRKHVEKEIKDIGKKAWKLAKHSERRTLLKKDIEFIINLSKK